MNLLIDQLFIPLFGKEELGEILQIIDSVCL